MRKILSLVQNNWCKLVCLLALAGVSGAVHAETPEQYAHRFATFKYEFHAEVQDPDVFLKTQKGDCDDFATVADDFLSREGYTTHLIAVRMPGETHVVLYVDEVHGYLDYNFRSVQHPVQASDGSLQHVAEQVAFTFGLPWTAVYEFNFYRHTKHLVTDIVKNDKAEPRAKAPIQIAAIGTPHRK